MFYTKTGIVSRRVISVNGVSTFPATPLKTIACKVEPVKDLAAAGLEGMPAYSVRQIFTRDMDMFTGDKVVIDGVVHQVQHTKPWDGLMSTYIILYCKISAGT